MSSHAKVEHASHRAWLQDMRSVCLPLAALPGAGLAIASLHAADPAGHSQHHGWPVVFTGVVLLALVGLGLAPSGKRGRRAAILSLGLLLGLFSIESGIHSVHHLWDPQSAASCALSSASQHAPGTSAATPDTGDPTWIAEPSSAFDLEQVRPLQLVRPREVRAPPALLSA